MTLRPGSADLAKPMWRGVLREDSYPAYICTHRDHKDQPAATACAKTAMAQVKESNTLPEGWITWTLYREVYQA